MEPTSGGGNVRPRGSDVVTMERWMERRLVKSRQVLKLRWVAKTGLWTLAWAFGGGRWLGRRPPDSSLERLLDAIELDQMPR